MLSQPTAGLRSLVLPGTAPPLTPCAGVPADAVRSLTRGIERRASPERRRPRARGDARGRQPSKHPPYQARPRRARRRRALRRAAEPLPRPGRHPTNRLAPQLPARDRLPSPPSSPHMRSALDRRAQSRRSWHRSGRLNSRASASQLACRPGLLPAGRGRRARAARSTSTFRMSDSDPTSSSAAIAASTSAARIDAACSSEW